MTHPDSSLISQETNVNSPLWVRVYRIVFGVLALFAVYRSHVIHRQDEHFIGFFTNQSNIIAGVILILGGTLFVGKTAPLWWEYVRGAGVMMMVTTGAVYALLLGGLYNPFSDAHPWSSSVLHQLIPIVMVIDLLLVPLSRRVSWWGLLVFPIYPLSYLGYSLWKGNRINWYPYDFMNPSESGGYGGVAVTIAVLLVGFVVISALVIVFSRMVSKEAEVSNSAALQV